MKRIKIFSIIAVILLFCIAGEFQDGHATAKGAAAGKVKLFEGKKKQLSSVHRIEADLDMIDFRIVSTKKQKSSFAYSVYCKNSKNPLQYDVKNGVLYLKETGYKELSHEERKQKFGDDWWKWKYRSKVTLYLPEKTGIKDINVTKGDLIIGKQVHFSDMDIQMEKGDLVISGLHVSGTTKINLKEGDLVAKTVVVPGNMQVTAKEGDITASDLKVSGNLQINSDEGDILVAQIGKKYFDAMTITAVAADGDMLVLGNMKTGKKKSKGCGYSYKKNGKGKGKLTIVTKEGDILLK